MSILVKRMLPDQAKDVQQLGRKTFKGVESFFVSLPKDCFIALDNDSLVGAIMIKFETYSQTKVGYIDFVFVDKDYGGKGIGQQLLAAAIDYMWEEGCKYITAIVKDDNVSSWQMLKNKGFNRSSYIEIKNALGLSGLLKLFFTTPVGFAIGMQYYILSQEETKEKKTSNDEIRMYIVMNMLLFVLFGFRFGVLNIPSAIGVLSAYIGLIFFGYLGTLPSKKQHVFRINECGTSLAFVLHLISGILPIMGNWYPVQYEKTEAFKKNLGLIGLMKWLFVIIITGLTILPVGLSEAMIALSDTGLYLMFMFCIPIYPFESFGSGRVFRWNKIIYLMMLAASIGVLVIR